MRTLYRFACRRAPGRRGTVRRSAAGGRRVFVTAAGSGFGLATVAGAAADFAPTTPAPRRRPCAPRLKPPGSRSRRACSADDEGHVDVVAASPEAVVALLASARSYGYVVPGAHHVRRFHPRWPEGATVLEHSSGLGALSVPDRPVVACAEPPRRLVLQARLRPLGTLDVASLLALGPEGWALTIEEAPVASLLARAGLRPLVGRAPQVRNAALVRRLWRVLVARAERAGRSRRA